MRNLIGFFVLIMGCGDEDVSSQCQGAACGVGPRIQITAQRGFGYLNCDGEAANCVMDFGTLAPGRASESWTDLRNVGDSTLHLSAMKVTDPVFEVRQPELQLEPGESMSFRVRVRLDAAGLSPEAQLHLDSDAVNGQPDSGDCTLHPTRCSRISVRLRARTES